MMPPVWLYWEGACPDWIAACRRTIRAHASDVRLVTPAEVEFLKTWDARVTPKGTAALKG